VHQHSSLSLVESEQTLDQTDLGPNSDPILCPLGSHPAFLRHHFLAFGCEEGYLMYRIVVKSK
jgi:hypothetical protein